MFGLGNIPASELVAIKFSDQKAFFRAVDIVAEQNIPCHLVGNFTLIIKKLDKDKFAGIDFTEYRVRDGSEVLQEELAALRKKNQRP